MPAPLSLRRNRHERKRAVLCKPQQLWSICYRRGESRRNQMRHWASPETIFAKCTFSCHILRNAEICRRSAPATVCTNCSRDRRVALLLLLLCTIMLPDSDFTHYKKHASLPYHFASYPTSKVAWDAIYELSQKVIFGWQKTLWSPHTPTTSTNIGLLFLFGSGNDQTLITLTGLDFKAF